MCSHPMSEWIHSHTLRKLNQFIAARENLGDVRVDGINIDFFIEKWK